MTIPLPDDPHIQQIIAILEKEPLPRSHQILTDVRRILLARAHSRRVIEIKKWLLDKGFRQKDLAKQLGVSLGFLNNIIHGRTSGRELEKALVNLGCPQDAFEKAA
jgi:hypothetical protein